MAAYLLTDPSIIAANPPEPRAPTTSISAPEPLWVTASAGGPVSRSTSMSSPDATSRARDGLIECAARLALEPGGDLFLALRMGTHARQQGGRRDDPQRRPMPLCL